MQFSIVLKMCLHRALVTTCSCTRWFFFVLYGYIFGIISFGKLWPKMVHLLYVYYCHMGMFYIIIFCEIVVFKN